jgi:acyl phosphate:glycerol-3-phosphate acyltransferase
MHPVVGLLVAYLLGSIPAAYIAGRLKGVDLRKHGSGNLGATNAWRVLGWKVGLPVYLFDMAKGALPVFLLPRLIPAEGWWPLAFGVAAIFGHYKPIYLGGKGGGKGVATAAGVFLALAPVATLLSVAGFAIMLVATGYVSMGSLTAAAVLVVTLLVTAGAHAPIFLFSTLIASFVFWTHRVNMSRLAGRIENRFATPGQLDGAAMIGVATAVLVAATALAFVLRTHA